MLNYDEILKVVTKDFYLNIEDSLKLPKFNNLNKLVYEFIGNDQKILFIQGSAGSGKTTFCYQTISNLVEIPLDITPLYISLGKFKGRKSNLITEVLSGYGFSRVDIDEFKTTHRFLFILDDYQELASFQNIYAMYQLSEWNAKIIVTCRTEYWLSNADHVLYFAPIQHGRVLPELMSKYIIPPLEKEYVLTKLDSKLHLYFSRFPFLLDLAKNPLFFSIINRQLVNGHFVEIDPNMLIKTILDDWFDYHEKKYKTTSLLEKNDTTFRRECWKYGAALAEEMRNQNVTRIYYQPSTGLFGDEISQWAKFFDSNNSLIDLLRAACPLVKDDDESVSFIHPEIFNYLTSQPTYVDKDEKYEEKLVIAVESTEIKPMVLTTKVPLYVSEHFLNQESILNQPGILNFWVDRVKENSWVKEEMLELVYASREEKALATGAANAITILNAAKFSFSKMDISKVCIQHANLENGIFYGTNLSNTDLSGVNVSKAIIEEADFSYANLEGMILGELPNFQGDYDAPFLCMCFDPKEQLLAVGTGRGLIYIWDVKSGDRLHVIKGTHGEMISPGYWVGNWVKAVAFSPDSKLLASGGGFIGSSADTSIRLWDVKSGKLYKTFDGHTEIVNSICFSPDGNLLASASFDNTVRIVNIANSQILWVYQGHFDDVNLVCFSNDGRLLISASSDGTAHVLELSSKTPIHVFKGDKPARACAAAISPQGNYLALANENTILLWDFLSRRLLKTFTDKNFKSRDLVAAISFSNDQRLLASSTYSGRVYIWDIVNEEFSYTLAEESTPTQGISFYHQSGTPEEYLVAVAVTNGIVKFLGVTKEIKNKHPAHTKGHTGQIESIDYHVAKSLLISGGSDGVILWDIHNKALIKKIASGNIEFVTKICISQNGNLLAIATGGMTSEKSRIIIYDINKNQILYDLLKANDNFGRISGLAFIPNSRGLISGSWNGNISVWSMENPNIVYRLDEDNSIACRSLCLNTEGDFLATGMSRQIYIWKINNPNNIKKLHTLTGHTDCVESICFNSDGTILASASWDMTVRLWSILSGTSLYTLEPHKNRVESVCFSQNGRWLLSASADISIWDMVEEKNVCSFSGHKARLRDGIRFINDNQFVTGCWDHAIRLWNLNVDKKSTNVSLQWISHSIGLMPRQVNIGWALNLSQRNRRLFEQHGAIDKDHETSNLMKMSLFLLNDKRRSISTPRIDTNSNINNYKIFNQLSSIEIDSNSVIVRFTFSNDGKWLATGMTNRDIHTSDPNFYGTIYLYNLETKTVAYKFVTTSKGGIYAIDIDSESSLLAAGSKNGLIYIWDIASRKLLHTIKGNTENEELKDFFYQIQKVNFHPNLKLLASHCFDGTSRVWNIENKEAKLIYQIKENGIGNVAFDLSGKWLMITRSAVINVHDINEYKKTFIIKNPTHDPILCMDFHPNGKWLATGHGNVNQNDKSICLWDIEEQKIIKKFKGPTRVVKSVAFHRSGIFLAAASLDDVVYLWNIKSEVAIQVFKWPDANAQDIQILFHPKEDYLAALGKGNIIRRWYIDINYQLTENKDEDPEYKTPSLDPSNNTETPLDKIKTFGSTFRSGFLNSEQHNIDQSAHQMETLKKKYGLVDLSQNMLEKGLRKAAANNYPDDLKIFIKKVKNINVQDDNPNVKKTALHWAVAKKHIKCIEILVGENADTHIIDAEHKSALDYAGDDLNILNMLVKISDRPKQIYH